ncbi:MAG TPA: CpXC domain-containing protein, partial [Anaerolineae bacterium]|nr:CpXC domain-containing protein [Anaerolineae bacterium]
MSTSPRYQAASITCPNCQTRFVTPIITIVDAERDPQAKSLLLSGQANVAICPQCGHGGQLSTPFVYHDAGKEIFYTFVPQQFGLREAEQERTIGDLTNRVISSLPPEKRKGYLLQPRRFLTMDSLLEAVLEAEGITPEMMQAQRDRAELLDRLLQEADREERAQIVRENEHKIDLDFFQMLGLNVQLAQAQGVDEVADELLALREQLLESTEAGREVADREAAIRELGSEITREGLLDKLVEAALAGKQARVETMVAMARPAIDYAFFQQLSERITGARDAGDAARADTLT